MTRDEHSQIVKDLVSLVSAEHQADATKLLTKLSEDYEETLTKFETTESDNKKLSERNEKLREVNSELFLKVGTTKKPEQSEGEKPPVEEGGNETMKFEDLFNEKGELK